MNKPVYLDNHATTPVDERVLNAMLPYFRAKFGNAASGTHSYGWEADSGVAVARKRIAELAGASPDEIVFTSGATESDNLALKGTVPPGGHLVTVATEHKAVLDTAQRLEESGRTVTVLSPGRDGRVDPDELRGAIRGETVLVSVMFANNEIGTIQPVSEIGRICRERKVLFHCDAVQAFGKMPVNVNECGIDLMSVSAHKMYGPKGVGALYTRHGLRLAPAQRPHGRLGKRDPLEAAHSLLGRGSGLQDAVIGLDAVGGKRRQRSGANRHMNEDRLESLHRIFDS